MVCLLFYVLVFLPGRMLSVFLFFDGVVFMIKAAIFLCATHN